MTFPRFGHVGSALLAFAVLGCFDGTTPSSPVLVRTKGEAKPPKVSQLTPGLTGYLVCSVQPEQADTFSVGAPGGTFKVGKSKLKVLKDALPHGVRRVFEMRLPSDSSRSVIFSPVDNQGPIVFERAVEVELDYQGCSGGAPGDYRVLYTTDANDPSTGFPRVLGSPPTGDDGMGTAWAATRHFSRYAIAY